MTTPLQPQFVNNSTNEHSYLIIAGTTKAGTGSLFKYISDHPDVCGSNTKETRFFFDQSWYQLNAIYSFKDGVNKYDTYFSYNPDKYFRIEATPDYMYSPATPQIIRMSLRTVKLIFLLRHPIDRLISWYRFSKQQGLLSDCVSIDEYVSTQFDELKDRQSDRGQQHLLTLEQGLYSKYLIPFYDVFNCDNILAIEHNELKNDPLRLCRTISSYWGINPDFFDSYNFKIVNPTRTMRNQGINKFYLQFRQTTRAQFHDYPLIRKILHKVRLLLEPLYLAINSRSNEKLTLSDDLASKLEAFYASEPHKLAALTGQDVFLAWI